MITESKIQREVITKFLEARQANNETFFAHPSYQLETELLYWVKQMNEEKSVEVLSEINHLQRAKLSEHPTRSLKNSLICTCTLFTRATISSGVTSEYAFNLSDVFIRQIESIANDDELNNLEYDMLHSFIKAIQDHQKAPYQNEIVDRAVYYIHDNILQKLTLEEVAEETNVSPSYLSFIFHKIVGITLSRYINMKKIDESKYFLTHTDSTLLDIALLFGFCNQSYYTSLFRKFNGTTPRKFKQISS